MVVCGEGRERGGGLMDSHLVGGVGERSRQQLVSWLSRGARAHSLPLCVVGSRILSVSCNG